MRTFGEYRKRQVEKLYASNYPAVDGLVDTWPVLLGMLIFAILDFTVTWTDPTRLIVLILLAAPGAIWFIYINFHAMRALLGIYGIGNRQSGSDDNG